MNGTANRLAYTQQTRCIRHTARNLIEQVAKSSETDQLKNALKDVQVRRGNKSPVPRLRYRRNRDEANTQELIFIGILFETV